MNNDIKTKLQHTIINLVQWGIIFLFLYTTVVSAGAALQNMDDSLPDSSLEFRCHQTYNSCVCFARGNANPDVCVTFMEDYQDRVFDNPVEGVNIQ